VVKAASSLEIISCFSCSLKVVISVEMHIRFGKFVSRFRVGSWQELSFLTEAALASWPFAGVFVRYEVAVQKDLKCV